MGSFEFGIYVYVWTLVLVIGDLSDLGFATSAQRFVPEYAKRGALDLLRGFLSRQPLDRGRQRDRALRAIGILAVRLAAHTCRTTSCCRCRSPARPCRSTP